MKLANSTDFSDQMLRRMVSWTCKQLGFPASKLGSVQFRNRARRSYSGHAYYPRRIVVSIGPASRFPTKPDSRPGMQNEVFADRTEALIAVTSHEIAHLLQWREGRTRQLELHRRTEKDARWHEVLVLRAFRAEREALLAAWSHEPQAATIKMTPSVVEKRADKAATDLARWQRKLKLAQTKVRKLRTRVKYYERKSAAKSST
jgi:hypothetical protein